jgi:hypothetical protein
MMAWRMCDARGQIAERLGYFVLLMGDYHAVNGGCVPMAAIAKQGARGLAAGAPVRTGPG